MLLNGCFSYMQANMSFFRTVLLMGFGLVAVFGSSLVHLSGAGPLGCLTVGLVAAFGWRKERKRGDLVRNICLNVFLILVFHIIFTSLWVSFNSYTQDPVAEASGVLWMLFQPFLFGLIGAAVRSEQIHDLRSLGKMSNYIREVCDL